MFNRINQTLISSVGHGLSAEQIIGGSASEIEDAARHARQLTGSDVCPPVLYKGHFIPAGKIGERRFSS